MKAPPAPANFQRKLSFDANPPVSVPLRFFLSAPLFAALAAVLLLWEGDAAWSSRWSPQTLALVHLLTLGCLTMCMVGALLQMLPVVARTPVPAVRRVGALVHALLCAGTLLLAAGFWLALPVLFALAVATLLPALLLFAGACVLALSRYQDSSARAIVTAIRLALAALFVTITLGALLAGAWLLPAALTLPLAHLANLHAMWGLLGWVGLLVIGIAFQVVPMFQATRQYPLLLTGWYAPLLFTLLICASVGPLILPALDDAPLVIMLLGYGIFPVTTLWLLAHRHHPKADTTTLYMRLAMASLLSAAALWLVPVDPGKHAQAQALAVGVLFIAGCALSMVSGMLYKIVPFLVRLELQARGAANAGPIPQLRNIIPAWRATGQFVLHVIALALLLAACYRTGFVRPAAAATLLSCIALCSNLINATRLYLRMTPRRTMPRRGGGQ